MAASYRLLEDHWLSDQLVAAGTTITEGDGVCPVGWVPTGNVDPLNTDATNAFYNAGPQLLGLVRQQFVSQMVNPPITYWIIVGGFGKGFNPGFMVGPPLWQLTGLGSNVSTYPPIQRQL